jgi:hypothetical protein
MRCGSFAIACVLAGCGSTVPHDRGAQGTAAPAPAGDPTCPVELPGTSVAVEDTARGAALVFVTTGDAKAVQERAAAFAAQQHAGATGFAGMIETPSTATAAPIDHGARVELTATASDGAAALQNELRMHVEHLASGTCKMAM